jgi:hypothetical protein
MKENLRLKAPESPSDLATAAIWGYLGLACRLNGCGGWI